MPGPSPGLPGPGTRDPAGNRPVEDADTENARAENARAENARAEHGRNEHEQAGRFDPSAGDFDRRAGLPPAAVAAIAESLVDRARPGLVLELGAGTGELGMGLGQVAPAGYLGLDVSTGMLRVFRRRLERAGRSACLARADVDRPWPVRDRSVGLLFASRAAHLFDAARLAREARRVAGPGGLLVALGRVRRGENGVRARMRRELHRLLREEGHAVRGDSRSRSRLAEALSAVGARRLGREPLAVAEWPTRERPADSLADWRAKPGLAGETLEPEIQRRLLTVLEQRARVLFDDLSSSVPSTETYALTFFQLDAAHSPATALPHRSLARSEIGRRRGPRTASTTTETV